MGLSESDLDWPDLDDLKRRLDMTTREDTDGELEVALAAAIGQTKEKRGNWDELTDMPDEGLATSALHRAIFLVTGDDQAKQRADASLYGHRQRYGIA